MCCLFGMIDYKHTLSRRQKTRIIRTLADSVRNEEPMLPGSLITLEAHSTSTSTLDPLIP